MEKRDTVTLQIRKLRKKLRQIEHLEGIERDLTDEELTKCIKKDVIRDELLELLAEYNVNNSNPRFERDFDSSTSNISTDFSTSQSVPETDFSTKYTPSTSQTVYKESEPSHCIDDIDGVRQGADEDVISVDDVDITGSQFVDDSSRNNDEAEEKDDEFVIVSSKNKRNPSPERKEPEFKKPAVPLSNPSPSKKSKNSNKDNVPELNRLCKTWRNSGFVISTLESHNDLVTAVDCSGPIFVTASRDTTVKIWDFKTLKELRSLGSHTGSVTDVVVLSSFQLVSLAEKLGIKEGDFLVLSGSVDCSLKLWSANTGELLNSIYTYNPITKIAFHKDLLLVVTTSGGGKLELWDILTKENICSEKAHSDSITGLCIYNKSIFTSCGEEGEIKVFEVRDRSLHCMYVSEKIRSTTGTTLEMRHVRSLNVKGDNLYYGDDGVNIKILCWKKGVVKKLPNHKEDFGMTDAICCHGNLMLTTAYDLDTGQGYINAFDTTSEPSYITSVNDEETGRIMNICCSNGDTSFVTMVTAGVDLKVWRQVPLTKDNPDIVPTSFIPTLSQLAQDSDMESDVEFTDSESEDENNRHGSRRGSALSQNKGWGSWCNII